MKLLTQGAALLGLGSLEGCQQSEPPHINAPYSVSDGGTSTTAPSASASAEAPPSEPIPEPHMNAPYIPPDAGANGTTGAAPTATIATSQPSGKPAPHKFPTMNAPQKPPHVDTRD